MNEAWFTAQIAPWFSMLSLFSLLAYLQVFAIKGQHRPAVIGAYHACTSIAGIIALIGLYGMANGQPQYVWGTLVFAGGLTTLLMIYATWHVRRLYEKAELRKTVANDL